MYFEVLLGIYLEVQYVVPVRTIEAFLTSARGAVNDEIQVQAALPPGDH